MKKGSTLFLKLVIFALGLIVLALCIFVIPAVWKGGSAEYPMASQALLLIMLGMYVSAIPFYIALSQAFKLLKYIDENRAFSELSIQALRNIKYCATIISILYLGGVPLLLPIAQADDAPGLVLFGATFACAPAVIAVFAALLERLLKSAIDIKHENDLTV